LWLTPGEILLPGVGGGGALGIYTLKFRVSANSIKAAAGGKEPIYAILPDAWIVLTDKKPDF